MKKELKSGILSAYKSADCRPTVGGVNVIAVLTFYKFAKKTTMIYNTSLDLVNNNEYTQFGLILSIRS